VPLGILVVVCRRQITDPHTQDYARHGGRDRYENERAALLGDRYPGAGRRVKSVELSEMFARLRRCIDDCANNFFVCVAQGLACRGEGARAGRRWILKL
jgi:hypothetical protein